MSILGGVTKGKQIGAQIHTIYGVNGVGKTTWAASFPEAVIIDLESGSHHLDVARVPSTSVPSLEAFKALLVELKASPYKTIVVDSLESLEGLIFDFVIKEGKVQTIEKYDGGFGKGYVRAREIMRELFQEFQILQRQGITTVLVGHSQVKTQTDPVSNAGYDRHIMRINDKVASIVRDLSDNVFFTYHKVSTVTEGNKTKAYSDGQRVLVTQWRASADAKNRLGLPYEIPLSYQAFADALITDSSSSDELMKDIESICADLKDPSLAEKILGHAKQSLGDKKLLNKIKDRALTYANT